MKIIACRVGKNPKVDTIDGSYESIRNFVDGYMEACYPFDDEIALVCNEEGKLMGLPINLALTRDNVPYDLVVGDCFLCGIGEEDFTDIPDELVDKYLKIASDLKKIASKYKYIY